MKRLLSIMTIIALMGSILVGCNAKQENTQSNTSGGTTEEEVTIKYLAWGEPTAIDLIEEIITDFEEINPSINVELEVPGDYWPKLQTMITGNSAPDVFWLGFPEYQEYSKQGVVLKLDDLMAAEGVTKDMYLESGINAFSNSDGEVEGIPKDYSTYVIYFNKTLFEEAGIKSPADYYNEGNWNMSTMLECAKAIQEATDVEYGVAVESGRWKAFAGPEWVDSETKEVNINQSEIADSLQFLADLWLVEGVAPTVDELNSLGVQPRFVDQNVAMFMSGRWMGIQVDNDDFQFDIVPMPANEFLGGTEYTWVDSVGMSIASTSEHPEEAFKFISYYTSAAGQNTIATTGHSIPANTEVIGSDAFLKSFNGEVFNQAHFEYQSSTLPVFDNWGEVWGEINKEFTDIWNGAKPASEVVETAQQAVDSIK